MMSCASIANTNGTRDAEPSAANPAIASRVQSNALVGRVAGSFGNMSTNVQTHTDLIWSIQFDKTGALIGVITIALLVVPVVVFARRRKKT